MPRQLSHSLELITPAIAMNICPARMVAGIESTPVGVVEVPLFEGAASDSIALMNDLFMTLASSAEFATTSFFMRRYGMSREAFYGVIHKFRTFAWVRRWTLASVTLRSDQEFLAAPVREYLEQYGKIQGYVILERLGSDMSVQLGVPAYLWYRSLPAVLEDQIVRGLRFYPRAESLVIAWVESLRKGIELKPIKPIVTLSEEDDGMWGLSLPIGKGLWVSDPDFYIRRMLRLNLDEDRVGSWHLLMIKDVRFALEHGSFTTEEFMRGRFIDERNTALNRIKRLREELARVGLTLASIRPIIKGRRQPEQHLVVELATSPARVYTNVVRMLNDLQDRLPARSQAALYIRTSLGEALGRLEKDTRPEFQRVAKEARELLASMEDRLGELTPQLIKERTARVAPYINIAALEAEISEMENSGQGQL